MNCDDCGFDDGHVGDLFHYEGFALCESCCNERDAQKKVHRRAPGEETETGEERSIRNGRD